MPNDNPPITSLIMRRAEILDTRRYAAADVRAIAELLVKVWPKPGKTVAYREEQLWATGMKYLGPDNQAPRSVVVRDGSRIVAHAALIPRTVATSRGKIVVAGLSRVCSDPELRGQGLGVQVVMPIFELVDRQVFEFSLFQTTPLVRSFYERLGACVVTNRFVNSLGASPDANPFWDEVVMRYPSDRDWPSGIVDLLGPAY